MLCAWQGEMLVLLKLLPAHAEQDLVGVLTDFALPLDLKRNDKRAAALSRGILFPANQWHGEFPAGLELGFHGTDLQWELMRQMLKVPAGKTVSYGQLAKAAKQPLAARAAGSVCARNPLPFIVPCHRITASAGLGGYGYGTALKRQLLSWENQTLTSTR